MGSAVVAHGLSCPAACGIFPEAGLNSCSLIWQADSSPLDHKGSATSTLKHSLENSRGKGHPIIFTHISVHCIFSSFQYSKVPSFTVFFVLGELPLTILLKYVCWQQALLVVVHLRKSRFPLHSRNIFSLGTGFRVDSASLLIFKKKKKSISFSLCAFLMRNLLSFEMFLGKLLFSFWPSLSIFAFSFQKLYYDVSFHGCLRECPIRGSFSFFGRSNVEESSCMRGFNALELCSISGLRRSPEGKCYTHSSILAWRNPWAEEPGELLPMGSQGLRHEWVTNTHSFFNV